MEEPHLGLGDLRQRLAVDAAELEEGHQREAGAEHGGDVVQRLDVLVAELLEALRGQPEARPEALDQRRLQVGELGRLLQRARRLVAAEELLDVPVGEPTLLARLLDLLELVPAVAEPRHDARVRHRGGGPLALAVELRDHALARPSAQRLGRDAHSLGGFLQRNAFGHGPHCVARVSNGGVEGFTPPLRAGHGPRRRPLTANRQPVSTRTRPKSCARRGRSQITLRTFTPREDS